MFSSAGGQRRIDKLAFKFSLIFIIFTIITLALCGVSTYHIQVNRHNSESMNYAFDIAEDLRSSIFTDCDQETFLMFQEYMLGHSDEIYIPYGISEYNTAREKFYRAFGKKYPKAIFGKDVTFNELPIKLKRKYATYYQEYLLITFERMRKTFGVPYTYYAVPTGDGTHVKYLVDMERIKKKFKDGRIGIKLCDDVEESKTINTILWQTWESGNTIEAFDNFNNEYGTTNSYYVPLTIRGEKKGLICVDVDAKIAKKEITENTVRQMIGVGFVLIVAVMITMAFIKRKYINKITRLSGFVRDYASRRDLEFLEGILSDASGRDEISQLAGQLANMIATLDDFSRHIEDVTDELSDTRAKADGLKELATTDSMTGLNNKTAYDSAVAMLEAEIAAGTAKFAIVMADLNFLKRINDTYGHEYGNIAIKKLADMIMRVFAYSEAYRIGGDEFVVIVEGKDLLVVRSLINQLNLETEKDTSTTEWEHISVALGMARFGEVENDSFEATFNRADEAMYERKKAMKAVRRD